MFKNYLSSIPYFEDKGYITSEFTFGFEFEGFINSRAFNAFEDLTKGKLSLSENDTDDVIMKSEEKKTAEKLYFNCFEAGELKEGVSTEVFRVL